jgi:hypothetical protein
MILAQHLSDIQKVIEKNVAARKKVEPSRVAVFEKKKVASLQPDKRQTSQATNYKLEYENLLAKFLSLKEKYKDAIKVIAEKEEQIAKLKATVKKLEDVRRFGDKVRKVVAEYPQLNA